MKSIFCAPERPTRHPKTTVVSILSWVECNQFLRSKGRRDATNISLILHMYFFISMRLNSRFRTYCRHQLRFVMHHWVDNPWISTLCKSGVPACHHP
jgi:hypothetical protein